MAHKMNYKLGDNYINNKEWYEERMQHEVERLLERYQHIKKIYERRGRTAPSIDMSRPLSQLALHIAQVNGTMLLERKRP